MKDKVIEIIKKASKIALEYQEKITVSKKEDSTIVTEGDIAVSDFLIKELGKIYPVLSEEEYDESLISEQTVFLIDPIDGTVSYSKNQDTWMMIITLVENDKAKEAWIYQPAKDKMFYAKKGEGAVLIENKEEKVLKVSNKLEKIIVSPNYKKEDLELIPILKEMEFQYGAALKITTIAEGQADVYPIKNRYYGVWDLMGPELVLTEAGGHFTFLDGYSLTLKDKKLNHPFIASSIKI